MYWDLSTASEVFLIVTTRLYQFHSVSFLFALFSDNPEVFLPYILPNSNTSCCSLPEGSTLLGGLHIQNSPFLCVTRSHISVIIVCIQDILVCVKNYKCPY